MHRWHDSESLDVGIDMADRQTRSVMRAFGHSVTVFDVVGKSGVGETIFIASDPPCCFWTSFLPSTHTTISANTVIFATALHALIMVVACFISCS